MRKNYPIFSWMILTHLSFLYHFIKNTNFCSSSCFQYCIFSTCVDATPSINSDSGGNMTDRFALLALKRRIQIDPKGALSSWNHSLHHCRWEGIICGHSHKRVILLNLWVGTISPYIGNLTFLRYVFLVTTCWEVQFLLRSVSWAYTTTHSLGKFQPPYPSENNLVGRIPQELSSLSLLKGLYVYSNSLKGPIFRTIENLTSFEYLSGSFNSFEGWRDQFLKP